MESLARTPSSKPGSGLVDLADANGDHNLVYSPLSIYAALALLATGARGATLDEVLRVLGARGLDELASSMSVVKAALSDRSASGGPSVAFAHGVWSDWTRPLKPAYPEARTVDFRNGPEQARQQINAWAKRATRNLVDSVLPPGSVSSLTDVVLGNAVYFKGEWDRPFERRHTAKKLFYRLDRGVVYVPFIRSTAEQLIAVHQGFKVLKLRYKMKGAQKHYHKNVHI